MQTFFRLLLAENFDTRSSWVFANWQGWGGVLGGKSYFSWVGGGTVLSHTKFQVSYCQSVLSQKVLPFWGDISLQIVFWCISFAHFTAIALLAQKVGRKLTLQRSRIRILRHQQTKTITAQRKVIQWIITLFLQKHSSSVDSHILIG